MLTIKKRKISGSPKGILRREPKTADTPRKVGFVDDIGKPLVEYRDLPPKESNKKETCENYHHMKTSGRLISADPYSINQTKWNLYPVKNVKPPRNTSSELKMIEERRLEDSNISRAPLFGTFDAFESPDLIIDATARALQPVPIIPSKNDIIDIPPLPSPAHTYNQVFESTNDQQGTVDSPPKTTSSVFDLMSQLKQRGLIPQEQPASTSDNLNPMPTHNTESNSGRKIRKPCLYYMVKPNGCNRGDSCRFEHDDVQRGFQQQKHLHNRNGRNDSWRPRHQRDHLRSSGDGRRIHRSRSPQSVA
ncbi:hypothetical protein GCK72_009771 [Caenorhabditis remanei]|uniref:C3H1-type domain-containing protein n=1 Tax=Caenorhabditis remanei TaxID=31234 RepID=A0A6A5H3G5_CAERE|nr:hypothetical protein GCK72_009771 [Caenorhabditis remanei]KAF1761515.1 hypothetical protein GCK72_009771 [Caenorhabditis remanei]